ncbi:kinetochore protein Mal2 [Schizosaccharomyces japonicus yFS275]|uniref:Kinetochore protein Mal2 n=1 Tax=Schizosaccharomyces japonicus (strain yFS275 / FY16936) TaxID=402676 RepID=B6K775_SCHJY|nr:kinetochore protein Mal2 [Schizosaccharomyces japonicus yFS275]EEB09379.1 kinetochore protein Mal2 [Schizosaccharomyces japonicus yFS275]
MDAEKTLHDEIAKLVRKKEALEQQWRELHAETLQAKGYGRQHQQETDDGRRLTRPEGLFQYDRLPGISFFQPNDPERLFRESLRTIDEKSDTIQQPSMPQLLGVRFDVMKQCVHENSNTSAAKNASPRNAFDVPHYIIFRVSDNSFDIYKHTLPNYIPMHSLARQFLQKGGKCTNLRAFLLHTQQSITAYACRRDMVKQIKTQAPKYAEIRADLSCTRVSIVLRNSWRAKIVFRADASTRLLRAVVHIRSSHGWEKAALLEAQLVHEREWLSLLLRAIRRVEETIALQDPSPSP